MISSAQNDRVKLAHALQNQAKARRKEGKIALEGVRLIRDACKQGLQPDFILYTPGKADADLMTFLEERGAKTFAVADDILRHVSDTEQPQGVVGVFPMPTPELPAQPARVLIVDNLRDPGNLGTMLRTAAAAGVQAVLLSPGSVDPYNPKALRGGMGAQFRVIVVEASWEQIGAYCAGLNIYLADMVAETAYDKVDWTSPWALIISSEAHGASAEAEQIASARIFIPMAADTESLNAAVAAGVLLFEAERQRQSNLRLGAG
jgi:RNA methyltransferase, TrmH family